MARPSKLSFSLAIATLVAPLQLIAQAAPVQAVQVAPPSDPAAEAEALLQQGIAQRRAGQDQLALNAFRRANELAPAPRVRAQMALAEQALGQWASADIDLRAALQQDTDPWIVRNRASLESALNSITSRLATVDIVCNREGAMLLINGREIGTFPLAQPLRVESGAVALEVRQQGYRTLRRTIDVEGGRTFRESFTLLPMDGDTQDPDPRVGVNTRPRGTRIVRRSEEMVAPRGSTDLIIAGSALGVAAVASHLIWQNRVGLYNSGRPNGTDVGDPNVCFNPTRFYPTRSERCDAVLSESWAAFGVMLGGYILGGAALATGVGLRLFRSERRVTETVEMSQPTATLSCLPGIATLSVNCVGTF